MIKILVPTDYSECSIAALKHAAALACQAEGALLIVHVDFPQSLYIEPPVIKEPNPLEHDVAVLLETMKRSQPPLSYEERRVEGAPAPTILSLAEEEHVDLIVMGTTGRTGLKRLLMGSVAEEVVRRASCPVLTLRASSNGRNGHSADAEWERWTTLEQPPVIPASATAVTAPESSSNPTLALISRAIAARASDVHIDPMGQDFSVRFRIDGQLSNYCRLSHEVGHVLMTQLKVTANLNIADPFHSQEGRLQLPESLSGFEVRITTARVLDGEAISLRVLSRHRLMRPMEELGLSPESQSKIGQILKRGEGLVLVTGPTGSGKTTTLYSMLHSLDDGSRNIVTIEDPVEYNIPSFRQMPVDARHGTTMTSGLRTLLRLDPDVVLVGEIRDAEAAETAMRAASSGKYVFSSLHTRDVASTVTALRDLHIDNRSLAGNLVGIVSQRLVRRLCPECSRSAATTEYEQATFRACGLEPPTEVRHPVGCPHCRGNGYYDRIGVFEVVAPEHEIVQAIERGEPEDELRVAIRSHGVSTLEIEALKLAALGVTSLEECAGMTSISPPHPVACESCAKAQDGYSRTNLTPLPV